MNRVRGPITWRRQFGILACLLTMLGAGCGEPPAEPASPRESAASTPTNLEITCEKNGETVLSSDRVQVRADGVHFTVYNRTGEGASINGLVVDVDAGTSEHVSSVAPGRVEVACWAFSDHGRDRPEGHALEVLDPDEIWVDPELDCPPGAKGLIESSISDFVPDAEGDFTDPVEAAKDYFNNLEVNDVAEVAGYPEGEPPVVRVVRDGRVVATAGFLRADDGSVLVETHEMCASTDIKTGL